MNGICGTEEESRLQRFDRAGQPTWGYGEYASTPGYYLNGFQPYLMSRPYFKGLRRAHLTPAIILMAFSHTQCHGIILKGYVILVHNGRYSRHNIQCTITASV